MAVPKRAQAAGDVLSEAGQQQADADQGRNRGNKPDGGLCERWGRQRREVRCCDLGLVHDEHLQTIQLVWGNEQRDPSIRAARSEVICLICTQMSVAGGTHDRP